MCSKWAKVAEADNSVVIQQPAFRYIFDHTS